MRPDAQDAIIFFPDVVSYPTKQIHDTSTTTYQIAIKVCTTEENALRKFRKSQKINFLKNPL